MSSVRPRSIDHYHPMRLAPAPDRALLRIRFDPFGSDAYALHRQVVEDDAGELADTTLVLRRTLDGFAGGSGDRWSS